MILGTELRRSTAVTAGALVAALGIAGLYLLVTTDQSELWDVQWSALAIFQRVLLVVLWPLALGAGAWQARRDRRSKMEELLGTTARPTWRRMVPTAGAMAIGLAGGYLLVFVAGAVRVAGSTTYFHLSWIPVVLVGALSLIAAGWLGMGVGRLIPSTYTPPVLAVLGFVLLLVPTELMKYESVTKLVHLAPGSFNVGEEFDAVVGTVDVAQAAWFGGLALAGAVLFMVSRRAAIAAVVPVVVGLIIAVPVLNAGPASGVQIDAGAVAEVCTTDSGPEVCVLKAHESALSTLVGPAREALTLMAKLPNAPTSVHEVTPDRAQPQPASQVWLSSENYFAGHGWEDGLLQRVLAGAGTLPCPDSDGRTRMLVGNALAGTEPKNLTGPGQEEWKAETTALWQALKALPADERDRRIAAVRAAGLTCGDVTAALGVGGGA